MTKKEVLARLAKCAADEDTEMAHVHADYALCKFLIALGHGDVVELYESFDKWHA